MGATLNTSLARHGWVASKPHFPLSLRGPAPEQQECLGVQLDVFEDPVLGSILVKAFAMS